MLSFWLGDKGLPIEIIVVQAPFFVGLASFEISIEKDSNPKMIHNLPLQ